MRVYGSFLVGFWRIMGNKREFSYRARELLRVFERVHRGVLGSSVMKVMECRCDGILGAGSTGAIFSQCTCLVESGFMCLSITSRLN